MGLGHDPPITVSMGFYVNAGVVKYSFHPLNGDECVYMTYITPFVLTKGALDIIFQLASSIEANILLWTNVLSLPRYSIMPCLFCLC